MRVVAWMVWAAVASAPCFAQASPEEIAAHAAAAQDAQRLKDFPRAIREYEQLARWLPQSAELQSNLGIALYFNKDLPDAISRFHKALAINPNLATPHLFTGLAWYRLANPDAAVPELRRAVELNGSDVVARTWLAYGYIAQSRYEAAVEQLQAACNLDSDNTDVWYALGEAMLRLGKAATAKLLAVAPDGGRAWQLAGEQFELQNNRERALVLFEGALRRRPDLTDLRSVVERLGGTPNATEPAIASNSRPEEDELYRQAHDYEQKAREAFERVAHLAPDSYRAHQILADSYLAQQRQDDAIAEYRAVLAQKPDLPGIHEAIGNVLLSVGNMSEALQQFQAELEIQPHSATAHMNVGRALLLLGDDAGAEKMLSKALQLDRPPAEVYKLLGKIDLHRHDYPALIHMLNRYVETVPDDSSAYYLLMQGYRAVGDSQQVQRTALLYRKTSQGARERTIAQKALENVRKDNDDVAEKAEPKTE